MGTVWLHNTECHSPRLLPGRPQGGSGAKGAERHLEEPLALLSPPWCWKNSSFAESFITWSFPQIPTQLKTLGLGDTKHQQHPRGPVQPQAPGRDSSV